MGIAVPIILFLLFDLHSVSELLTIAATTFLSWGVGDFLATILERPRLRDRSPGRAIRILDPEQSEGSTENPR